MYREVRCEGRNLHIRHSDMAQKQHAQERHIADCAAG